MAELEKIEQRNLNLCGYEAIYVVVTHAKAACDSGKYDTNLNDFDWSDFAGECPEDAEDLMEIDQGELTTKPQGEAYPSWKQLITYLELDSVWLLKNNGAHLVMRVSENISQKL
jgi:hypothetical protein